MSLGTTKVMWNRGDPWASRWNTLGVTSTKSKETKKKMGKYGLHSGVIKAKVMHSGSAVALTAASAVAIDASAGKVFTLTPGQAETITVSNGKVGQLIYLVITTSGTSSRTLTFGTGFKVTGTLATGTTDGKVFTICFVSDGTNFNEVSRTAAM